MYAAEATAIAWYPDEGATAKEGNGTLVVEEQNGTAWEFRDDSLKDGGYEKYMMEAVTRGYVDLTRLPPCEEANYDDEEYGE